MFSRTSLLCYLNTTTILYRLTLAQSTSNTSSCKAAPNTPSWPSTAQWNALNTSINGQLLAPLPPAAVCDRSLPVYDNTSCTQVTSQYPITDFHAKDPISVDSPNWENDACLPSSPSCILKQFPAYVANATNATHVQAAVNFAREQNVRLIVKGTGHDYLGR